MDLRTVETTLEFAEEASAAATGPDAKDALERLETRLDELLAAMNWFLEARRIDDAFRVANLSMVERQLGELDAAEALAREALEIEARTGDRFTTPFAISGLASIANERGEFDRAATLVGAAESIMEAQGMAWPPDERPHYERLLAILPAVNGPQQFERARDRGRGMSISEAVAFALDRQP